MISQMIAQEREKLSEIATGLRSQLDIIEREIAGLNAYEAAKAGKATKPKAKPKTHKGQRAPRQGSKRADTLAFVQRNGPSSRSEIINAIGIKGNRSSEMAISNVCTALIKNGELVRHNGKYVAHTGLRAVS